MMMRHARSRRFACVAVVLGLALALASCAAMQQTAGGWVGTTPTPAPAAAAARTYYAGAEDLKVYSEASAASKVVGVLALHEKVTRSKLERGYAFVESAKSGVKGWVDNAQLIWHLPSAPTTGAPAPGEPRPEEPVAPKGEEPQAPPAPEATATEPLPTTTPVPAGSPRAKQTPGGVAPSIFDAY